MGGGKNLTYTSGGNVQDALNKRKGKTNSHLIDGCCPNRIIGIKGGNKL